MSEPMNVVSCALTEKYTHAPTQIGRQNDRRMREWVSVSELNLQESEELHLPCDLCAAALSAHRSAPTR